MATSTQGVGFHVGPGSSSTTIGIRTHLHDRIKANKESGTSENERFGHEAHYNIAKTTTNKTNLQTTTYTELQILEVVLGRLLYAMAP